jgi:hypothetical protein
MKRFGEPPPPGADPYVRSVLKHRCVNVRGTVTESAHRDGSGDGDVKMKISIDELEYTLGYYRRDELLNEKNHGELTVEIVCAAPVTNTQIQDAVDACRGGPTYPSYVPKKGDVVDVLGELVTDTGPAGSPPVVGHGWREIHPVTRINPVTIK